MNTDNAPSAITSPNLIDVAEEEAAAFFLQRRRRSTATLFCRKARQSWSPRCGSADINCHPLPMTEFLKAGGACKCLTMFMPQRDKVG